MKISHFNIRVYGILIKNEKVLVSDELIKGTCITKFPGGGLEFGEGTIQCLEREFMEETQNQIRVHRHYYTTDYFQPSAFNASHQIMSIYYIVKPIGDFLIHTTQKQFDFDLSNQYQQTFRWVDYSEISEHHFTLPIDKVVGKLMYDKFRKEKLTL